MLPYPKKILIDWIFYRSRSIIDHQHSSFVIRFFFFFCHLITNFCFEVIIWKYSFFFYFLWMCEINRVAFKGWVIDLTWCLRKKRSMGKFIVGIRIKWIGFKVHLINLSSDWKKSMNFFIKKGYNSFAHFFYNGNYFSLFSNVFLSGGGGVIVKK